MPCHSLSIHSAQTFAIVYDWACTAFVRSVEACAIDNSNLVERVAVLLIVHSLLLTSAYAFNHAQAI